MPDHGREAFSTEGAADRRQLTVLFSDLAGSVAMSMQLDPEDLGPAMAAYQRRCAEIIERHRGFLARYMGDGILAYFGYPVADEADADLAVRAGLELVREIGKLEIHGVPLQARVGIATGEVIVGDLVGRGAAQERGVVGVTPNLAARLQAAAMPGTVVIGAATRRLVGGLFVYRDLGKLTLKGFDKPVQAWEVIGESTVVSRLEARAEGNFTPLVGRQQELAILRACWEKARAGEGQVVLIGGEAGLGKSRLTEELSRLLAGEPHIPMRVFCSPHRQETALYPSIALITRVAGLAPDDTPEEQLRKLQAALATVTQRPDEDATLLADLISIPTGASRNPLIMTPQQRKERTFAALIGYVTMLAERAPILEIYEDIHWADPTSRELLDIAVPIYAKHRVLMLVTHRPEYQPPWRDLPHVTTLSLQRLEPREGAALTNSVTGKALPPEIMRQIVDKSDGIPLFVEELTKAVLESGVLRERGDHYELGRTPPSLAVPASLHDSLVARLDRLGPARHVAHIGAAVGRVFSHDILAAVLRDEVPELEHSLRQLIDAELISPVGTHANRRYVFKHALIRDAAYASLLKRSRRALHARIAAAIEKQLPGIAEKEPEELGRHYTEAGDIARAIPNWRRAGERAASRAAYLEAADHFRRALGLVTELPETEARHQIELDLQCQLGPVLLASRGYTAPEVEATYDRARRLCEMLANPTELYGVLRGLWSYYYVRSDLRTSLALSKECIRIGEAGNAPIYLIEAYTLEGFTLAAQGRLADARARLERAVAMYESNAGHTLQFPTLDDPGIQSLGMLSLVSWMMGDVAAGEDCRDRAIRLAATLGHPFVLTVVHCYAAAFDYDRGMPASAFRHATKSAEIAREHGFETWVIAATLQVAFAKGAMGDTTEAIELFTTLIPMLEAVGFQINRSHFLAALARAYRDAGSLPEAMATVEEAIAHVERYEQREGLAPVFLLRGELKMLTGYDPRDGIADMLKSLHLARRQGARIFELRALLSLREWDDDGDAYEREIEPLRHLVPHIGARILTPRPQTVS